LLLEELLLEELLLEELPLEELPLDELLLEEPLLEELLLEELLLEELLEELPPVDPLPLVSEPEPQAASASDAISAQPCRRSEVFVRTSPWGRARTASLPSGGLRGNLTAGLVQLPPPCVRQAEPPHRRRGGPPSAWR
jgi:hypothetical protein